MRCGTSCISYLCLMYTSKYCLGKQKTTGHGASCFWLHVMLFMLLSYLLIPVQVKQKTEGCGTRGCVAACCYVAVLPVNFCAG